MNKFVNKKNYDSDESGFSLMELVVSVGILFTLTVSSFAVSAVEIHNNMTEETIESIVDSIYADAVSNDRGFDERFTVESAIEDRKGELVEFDVSIEGGSVLRDSGNACIWVKASGEDFNYAVDSEGNGCD